MISRVHRTFILSVIALFCVGCGVRGPLTVNPIPSKGVPATAATAPVDLRANPSAPVLYGTQGKTTPLPAPETK